MTTSSRPHSSALPMAAALLISLCSPSAMAWELFPEGGFNWRFTPRMSLQYAMANTTESVKYANGDSLSRLEWDLDGLFRLNLGATLQATDWLRLNLDYAFKIDEGDAALKDFDWFIPAERDWTHLSEHDDTVINRSNRFDVSLELPLYRAGATLFTGAIGYLSDDWEWQASGGTYLYGNTVGTFTPGERVISYEYTYDSIYLALGAAADVSSFSLSGRLLYSPWTRVDSTDTHHLRGLTFEEDYDDTSMFGISLKGLWRYNQVLSFFVAYDYTDYAETNGQTRITDTATGASVTDDITRGAIESDAGIFSIGLAYTF